MSATRKLLIVTVKYGRYPEFLNALKELIAYEKSLNSPPTRCWHPIAGANNRVVLEKEWPTLADLERGEDTEEWDKKHLQLRQKIAAEIVEGSAETLIWSETELDREFQ